MKTSEDSIQKVKYSIGKFLAISALWLIIFISSESYALRPDRVEWFSTAHIIVISLAAFPLANLISILFKIVDLIDPKSR